MVNDQQSEQQTGKLSKDSEKILVKSLSKRQFGSRNVKSLDGKLPIEAESNNNPTQSQGNGGPSILFRKQDRNSKLIFWNSTPLELVNNALFLIIRKKRWMLPFIGCYHGVDHFYSFLKSMLR